jgi:hypothetical protein
MNPISVRVRGYSGEGFGSSFIKWFTFAGKDGVSHVSLVFTFDNGSEIEFEAIQGKGIVNQYPRQGAFKEYSVPLSREQVETAYMVASSIHGKYDWKGIWGFIVKKNKHHPDKWFCSEYVAYVLYETGYPLSRRDPYRETPQTVCDSLRIG